MQDKNNPINLPCHALLLYLDQDATVAESLFQIEFISFRWLQSNFWEFLSVYRCVALEVTFAGGLNRERLKMKGYLNKGTIR